MFASADKAAGYLAAMIDGEGCVSLWREPWVRRAVRITSTDFELIEACSEACLLLGIEHRVHGPKDNGPRRRASWDLGIYRLAALRLVAELPLRAHRKRARLAEAIGTARVSRRPARDTLEQLYVFEDRSTTAIGRLLGVDRTTVAKWLADDGIARRGKAEAAAVGHRDRGAA